MIGFSSLDVASSTVGEGGVGGLLWVSLDSNASRILHKTRALQEQ